MPLTKKMTTPTTILTGKMISMVLPARKDPWITLRVRGLSGDYPEVGEVPFSCVWVARGTIVTQGMINSGADDAILGPIPGRTYRMVQAGAIDMPGRRDAIQVLHGDG